MDGLWLASYVALWAIVALLVLLVLGLAREIGAIHHRVGTPGALVTEAGLDFGASAPDFDATELPSGNRFTVKAATGRQHLIVFIATNCEPCRALLPHLQAGWHDWQRHADVHVVCEGEEQTVRRFVDETNLGIPVLADPEGRIRKAYGNPPTPHAFVLTGSGHVRLKGVTNARDDIDRLLDGQARVSGGREVRAVVSSDGQAAASPSTTEVVYGQVD